MEVICADFCDDFRFAEYLCLQAEDIVFALGGADFFGDFFLYEEDYEGGAEFVFWGGLLKWCAPIRFAGLRAGLRNRHRKSFTTYDVDFV